MTMTRNKNEKSGLSVASHLLFAGKLSTQTSDTITALWRDILLMMMLVTTQGKIDLRNESGRPMKVKVVGEVSEK